MGNRCRREKSGVRTAGTEQVSARETEIILGLARECLKVEGDWVELGCYGGDRSLLLARLLTDSGGGALAGGDEAGKRLWIYDSFEGLPERTAKDGESLGTEFKAGELAVSKREVVERLRKAGVQMPMVKKGFFEELVAERDLPQKIAFAFLDGDLYSSIKVSLKLVAPRMAPGGIMIIHDYNNLQLPGVARAVEEWARGRKIEVKESLAIVRF